MVLRDLIFQTEVVEREKAFWTTVMFALVLLEIKGGYSLQTFYYV